MSGAATGGTSKRGALGPGQARCLPYVTGRMPVLPPTPVQGSKARTGIGKITRMRSKSEIMARLTDPGIIAVVRARKAEQVLPVSEALIAGGVIAIEITMTTPNAIEAIRETGRKIGARGVMGVGTVLDAQT